MLAYTAGDGLNAIKRTYGVEATKNTHGQAGLSQERKRRISTTALRALAYRAGRLVAALTV